MGHTPGPWINNDEGDGEFVIAADTTPSFGGPWKCIAVSKANHEGSVALDAAEAEANANLIAAAPDLLASLCEFIRWEAEEPNTGEPTEEQAGRYMEMMRRAIEAVKKAGVTDLRTQP